MSKPLYIVVGSKPWNRRVFNERLKSLPGEWRFIGDRNELTLDRLRRLQPRYVFFLHWSWIVPAEIVHEFQCVCFHMTDVPYGRGGSPLQNLILRAQTKTKLTALRMTEDVDAGPIYMKRPLSLHGTAQEILIRASELSSVMIARMIRRRMTPRAQRGRVTRFVRRKPSESQIPAGLSAEKLYDFIRMLEAEGYPRAFIEYGGNRFEFSAAVLRDGRLTANVTSLPACPPGPPAKS